MIYERRLAGVTAFLAALFLSGTPAHAEGVQAVPTKSAADPSRIEVKPTDGLALRIPFDQPFTLIVPITGTEVGQADPELRFKVFAKALATVPTDVCDTGEAATFAGRFTTGTLPETKAHFLLAAQDPNKYMVFCFRMTAPLAVTLTQQEKTRLVADISGELQNFVSEIGEFEAAILERRLRGAIDLALARYSKSKGLAGRVTLSPDFVNDETLAPFRLLREVFASCDAETISGLLDDIEPALPDGPKSDFQHVRKLLTEANVVKRLADNRCRELYGRAISIVSTANFANPGDKGVALENLRRNAPPPEAVMVEKVLGDYTIPALQRVDSLLLATTLDGSSQARNYASADTGFAFVPELGSGTPYQGVNLYLRPVNPPSVTPLGSGGFRKSFLRRFSLVLGVTLGNDLEQSETIGSDTVNLVENFTSAGSLLGGFGLRVTPAFRIGGGAVVYRQLDTLVDRQASTQVSYYFSISLDIDVRSMFTGGGAGIFNGGSPPNTPQQ